MAPPLPLLVHVEASGGHPPSTVDPDALARAARLVGARMPAAPPEPPRPPVPQYYTDVRAGPPAPLLRALRGDVTCGQALHEDLRWHDSDELWRVMRGGVRSYVPISAERASELIDERWLIQQPV
jgi:hypothetical protein